MRIPGHLFARAESVRELPNCEKQEWAESVSTRYIFVVLLNAPAQSNFKYVLFLHTTKTAKVLKKSMKKSMNTAYAFQFPVIACIPLKGKNLKQIALSESEKMKPKNICELSSVFIHARETSPF